MTGEVKRQRRQTGASILRIYIPDYKREPLTVEEEAVQVAQELVSEFGKALRTGVKDGGTGKSTGTELSSA